jgi:hypothetical protein
MSYWFVVMIIETRYHDFMSTHHICNIVQSYYTIYYKNCLCFTVIVYFSINDCSSLLHSRSIDHFHCFWLFKNWASRWMDVKVWIWFIIHLICFEGSWDSLVLWKIWWQISSQLFLWFILFLNFYECISLLWYNVVGIFFPNKSINLVRAMHI